MALGKLPDEEAGAGGIFAEINITPLTDIFLVLLIIFMVSSSVIVETASREGVKVNLPKGASHDIDPGAKSLVVSVLKNNDIFVSGQPIKEEDLKALFVSSVAKDANTQVIIEADEGVTHGTVVHVMELAKDAGLVRLAIATRSSE
ncbi:MAG TPA: biopolymer transporter ExbD [Haliangiales bacterium]|nr:biopolymer transporter ExbD [Haliangiales bacterium]